MCGDFLNLEQTIHDLENSGVDYIHFDVMDGHFVPNFGLNLDIFKIVKSITSLPINVHLMVDNPGKFIVDFASAGCDSISFHQECTYHVQREIANIKEYGIQAGLAINPATPLNVLDFVLSDLDYVLLMTVNPGFAGQKLVPATLPKISDLRNSLEQRGLATKIQVDGNVSFGNIPSMIAAGATMLVGGTSSLFMQGMSIAQAVQKVHTLIP